MPVRAGIWVSGPCHQVLGLIFNNLASSTGAKNFPTYLRGPKAFKISLKWEIILSPFLFLFPGVQVQHHSHRPCHCPSLSKHRISLMSHASFRLSCFHHSRLGKESRNYSAANPRLFAGVSEPFLQRAREQTATALSSLCRVTVVSWRFLLLPFPCSS